MPAHGYRGKALRSTTGAFNCVWCGEQINTGDSVVGFFNANLSGSRRWQHVHAEACADQFVIEPKKNVSHPDATSASSGGSVVSSFKTMVSNAVAKVSGGSSRSEDSSSPAMRRFLQDSLTLGVSSEVANQTLSMHGGDFQLAFASIATQFTEDTLAQYQDDSHAADGDNGRDDSGLCEQCEDAPEDEIIQSASEQQNWSSNDARNAGYDAFDTFVRLLIPKPQTDGSVKDGDPGLLDSMMSSPITLALPRPEIMAYIIRPQDGWDKDSLERARAFFALSAAGSEFLLYLPTVTHRRELSRSKLFRVENSDGEVVGVRDCCIHCRSNRFTNTTDGGYNIKTKKDTSRNSVRFVHTEKGCVIPLSRVIYCRNPACPENMKKLEERGLTPPSLDKPLPRSKAKKDGKRWPQTQFSTHGIEYIRLIATELPALAEMYMQYMIFETEGGCDGTLAARLMQTTCTVAVLQKELELSAKMRERSMIVRYIAFMHDQQLQLRDDLPQLSSPLELSRPSSTGKAQGSQTTMPVRLSDIDNVFMRRFLALQHEQQRAESDEDSDENDKGQSDCGRTVTTVQATAQSTMRAGASDSAAIDAQPSSDAAPIVISTAVDNDGEMEAPPWLFINGGPSTILTMSHSNLRTWMSHIHKVMKPYLLADLLKRHPGECASHDHTFRLANRALGDAKAYSFLMGERHDIIGHWATLTKTYSELTEAFECLQKRFTRLGVSGRLKYWWDDLCCHDLPQERLHEHMIVNIFPGIKRCPYKDGFHAVQLVTSTFNAGTGEVDVFSREVGQALRPVMEDDLTLASKALMDSEKMDSHRAKAEAVKRFKGTGILRTYGPQPDELRVKWLALISRLRADRDVKGSKSVVRREYGTLRGTIEQMETMMSCIDKGCYSDPPALKNRLYVVYGKHATFPELKLRIKKSESVKNETVHKKANRLVQDIARMGEDLLEIRIDFFVAVHNAKVDAKLSQIDPITIGLPFQMRLINEIARSVITGVPFPSIGTSSDESFDHVTESSPIYECMGFDYYKSVRKARDAAKLAAAREEVAAAAAVKAAAAAAASSSGGGDATACAISASSTATSSKAAGKRVHKAKKGATQNLLNEKTTRAPENAHEIELMFDCVERAEKQVNRKGQSVWKVAADLYRQQFIRNCAVPEDERLLIRAPTTEDEIEKLYVAMAKRKREFNHAASSSSVAAAQAVNSGDAATQAVDFGVVAVSTDAEEARASAEATADDDVKSEVAAVKSYDGRQRVKRSIEGGRVLAKEEIATMGKKYLNEYLRAMYVATGSKETVSRALRDDTDALRERVKAMMGRKRTWSFVDAMRERGEKQQRIE